MAVDKSKLKMEGLKYGRLLQSVYRLAAMFTVHHRAADNAVRTSYEALNSLVMQVQQFTFGFMDHRVLLNNILTPDRTLRLLESEFSKRGIGAVTFPAGITLGGYRHLLGILCAKPEDIENNGGIKRFYNNNRVEGVRVIPGIKGASSTDETVLEGDPESLLTAHAMAMEQQPSLGLDLLLEAVGMGSGSVPGGNGGEAGGSGTGTASDTAEGMPGAGGTFSAGAGTGGAGSGVGSGGTGADNGSTSAAGGSGGSGSGTGGFGNGGTVGVTHGVTGMGAASGAGGGIAHGGDAVGPANAQTKGASAGTGAVGGQSSGGTPGSGGFGGGAPGLSGAGGFGGAGGAGVPGPGGAGGTGGWGGIGSNPKDYLAAGLRGSSAGGGGGGTGAGLGTGTGMGIPGTPGAGAGSGGGGIGSGYGPSSGSGRGTATGAGFKKIASAAIATNPVQALDLAQKALAQSFSNPNADPAQALNALSRMLEEFDPNVLLPALSPEKQKALKGRPAHEIAADVMEDSAVQWAANRMQSAPKENLAMAEEEVIRVLQRSLDATQNVESMLQKISRLFEKADLPPEFFRRIQQDLRWVELNDDEKYKHLMGIPRYTMPEFKRLLTYTKDAAARSRVEQATELVNHYFAILDLTQSELQPVELARAPELLQAVARLQTRDFMQMMAARLSAALLDEHMRSWFHTLLANCLAIVAHSMAPYEDFEGVYRIALELEKSRLRSPDQHKDCCGEALGNLLGPRSIERLIELYAQKREAQRMVMAIVKLMGRGGVEKVFQRLEEERVASQRFALIRLISQAGGAAATEVARTRLKDSRWYVVRNACFVLTELNDPELVNDLRSVIKHEDERVQQAAFNVIAKSKAPGRSNLLAEALLYLKLSVLDAALDELRFLKGPDGIDGLEKFIGNESPKLAHREKAMIALMAVPIDSSVDALARILLNQAHPVQVRRLAIRALGKSSLQVAYEALSEVASRVGIDPMAAESQKALEIE